MLLTEQVISSGNAFCFVWEVFGSKSLSENQTILRFSRSPSVPLGQWWNRALNLTTTYSICIFVIHYLQSTEHWTQVDRVTESVSSRLLLLILILLQLVYYTPWPVPFPDSIWNSVISQTVGRTPWTGDQPYPKDATYKGHHKHRKTQTYIHTSSGIRIHDPSIWAGENISFLIPFGHCDWH
jgi:hypothetical protein